MKKNWMLVAITSMSAVVLTGLSTITAAQGTGPLDFVARYDNLGSCAMQYPGSYGAQKVQFVPNHQVTSILPTTAKFSRDPALQNYGYALVCFAGNMGWYPVPDMSNCPTTTAGNSTTTTCSFQLSQSVDYCEWDGWLYSPTPGRFPFSFSFDVQGDPTPWNDQYGGSVVVVDPLDYVFAYGFDSMGRPSSGNTTDQICNFNH